MGAGLVTVIYFKTFYVFAFEGNECRAIVLFLSYIIFMPFFEGCVEYTCEFDYMLKLAIFVKIFIYIFLG